MTPQTPKHIVLYADDDPDDLDLVQDAFLRYSNNVQVVTASNGEAALQYLQFISGPDPLPALIILDISMPVLNGRDVLVLLREEERFKQIPVMLFTTSTALQDQLFAEKYNAGYATKPLDVSQMEMITELFIERCTEEVRKKIRRHSN